MPNIFNAYRPKTATFFIFLMFMVVAALPASAADKKILVLGDSLTAGYGLGPGQSFPDQLSRVLEAAGHKADVINAGVSGDTTAGGRGRIGWLLGGTEKPDLVIIELGANDGLRAIAPEATRDNLASIVEQAKSSGAKVLLTGMLAPPNLGQEYTASFNSVYPTVAKEYGIAFYPFFLKDVAGEPSLNQQDGIHPTAEGVGVILQNILPMIINILKGA